MTPSHCAWVSQCSAEIGDDEILMDAAARSGCRGLFLGLESLSEEGLKHWGKGFNRAADYCRTIERLHRHGIAVIAGMVFGHDWDTPAVFARTLEFLHPENRRVLAYLREHDGVSILCVANLSRFAQYVELDLSRFDGRQPVELIGRVAFPRIGELPYLLTLGPHDFYWFELTDGDG